ncbi:hypothetical protein ACHAWO_005905 [Cyclotella atomus]|uniref:Uncharacterized protein n=1 Tax=Cyclotella atomus TaxID=382360 RepID=A0ABD3NZX0_9STRA
MIIILKNMCTSNELPTVAQIGCGPSGMFFLHALATHRRKGVQNLPIVTCYESSPAPGGVWRSKRVGNATNMYEALWTNGLHYHLKITNQWPTDPVNQHGHEEMLNPSKTGSINAETTGATMPDRTSAATLTGVKYAEQQMGVMEDTSRTHVQAETTANTVLATLHAQRQQLQNANDDTWQMRTNVALAQRELKELQQKARLKKQRLYGIIRLLGFVDLMLFFRIAQCGGSFFCRRW